MQNIEVRLLGTNIDLENPNINAMLAKIRVQPEAGETMPMPKFLNHIQKLGQDAQIDTSGLVASVTRSAQSLVPPQVATYSAQMK